MSNQDYIASGVLELYAAGGLSQQEREEVERHAASSPEIRAALDEACDAMEAYAHMHAVAPRADLKNRILAEIKEDAAHTNLTDSSTAVEEQEPGVVPLYPAETSEGSAYKWMFAASIAIFLLSGMLSYHFYTKWQQAEDQLAVVTASEQLMAQNMQTTSLRSQQLEEALAVLRDPAFRPVRLQGVEAHPDANMVVYWNPGQQQVYIDKIDLPAPPAGMQYQLWALDNGKPVDAGMIALTAETMQLQKMKAIGSAQAFAVTLEPAGGSKNPTLEKLMVMGEVKA